MTFLASIGVLRPRVDIDSVEVWAPERAMQEACLQQMLDLVARTLRVAAVGGLQVMLQGHAPLVLSVSLNGKVEDLRAGVLAHWGIGPECAITHLGRELPRSGLLRDQGIHPGSWLLVERLSN